MIQPGHWTEAEIEEFRVRWEKAQRGRVRLLAPWPVRLRIWLRTVPGRVKTWMILRRR